MAKMKASPKPRGKSKKPDRDDAVEVRTGSLDLQEPVEIDSADFHLYFKAALSAHELKAKYNSLYTKNLAAAKKVNPFLPDAIKIALKNGRLDMDEIKAALKVQAFVLRETGCGVQITLHDVLAGDPAEVARKRGYEDGKAGRAANNKYPEDSDLSEAYIAEYMRGQAELVPGTGIPPPAALGHNGDGGAPE